MIDLEKDEDREEYLRVADKVEEFLNNCQYLHNYIEETEIICNVVNIILNDFEDDKLGRIRDLYLEKIKLFSAWVEENYTINKHAEFVYKEMIKSRE